MIWTISLGGKILISQTLSFPPSLLSLSLPPPSFLYILSYFRSFSNDKYFHTYFFNINIRQGYVRIASLTRVQVLYSKWDSNVTRDSLKQIGDLTLLNCHKKLLDRVIFKASNHTSIHIDLCKLNGTQFSCARSLLYNFCDILLLVDICKMLNIE